MVRHATIRKPACVESLYSEPRLLGVHHPRQIPGYATDTLFVNALSNGHAAGTFQVNPRASEFGFSHRNRVENYNLIGFNKIRVFRLTIRLRRHINHTTNQNVRPLLSTSYEDDRLLAE